MGFRALKEERMEELRLSRSSAYFELVDWCNGELPLYRCEGIADLGFDPGRGGDRELMTCGEDSSYVERVETRKNQRESR